MVHLSEFAGLFAVCFLAATVLPAQSEILLAGMVLAAHYPAWALVTVATVGNVLGSTANWLLGRLLSRFEDWRWFPIDRSRTAGVRGAGPTPACRAPAQREDVEECPERRPAGEVV